MELIEQFNPFVNIIIGFVVGGVVFLFFSFHKSKANGAYEKEKEIFNQSAKGGEYIHKNIHQEKLEKEYLRGIEKGKEEERKKLTINITPWLEIEDGMLWDTLYKGYKEQVTYNGFSIGQPNYHVIEKVEKFKQENLKIALETTGKIVERIANSYTSNLLTTVINPALIEKK